MRSRPILAVAGIAAVLVLAAVFWALRSWEAYLDKPVALPAPVIYTVPAHARFSKVASDLQAQGVIVHPNLWSWYARWQGIAAQIKAGEYSIAPGVTPRRLLRQLIDGQVLLHSFTIVDGWQVRELLEAMRRGSGLRLTLPPHPTDLMSRLGLSPGHPEGQFLPETYRFAAGTTDVALLTMAHTALVRELQAAWADRDARLPLKSPQELLTLASIVEKETGVPEERAHIAGVYVQRLLIGMRLQADPTVIYGIGERYDGDIRTADLHTDGPYNSYTRTGLPPTPIALPGAASIHASAHPDIDGALYFVASGAGDGSHVFSKNYTEHSQAVSRYLQAMRRRAGSANP
ncbi:MAG: endolytic transglycosylase MltG [Steroidobacteraceae bacterium]